MRALRPEYRGTEWLVDWLLATGYRLLALGEAPMAKRSARRHDDANTPPPADEKIGDCPE